ncbi:hypothetical protein D3C76_1534090 [compost metagenome]
MVQGKIGQALRRPRQGQLRGNLDLVGIKGLSGEAARQQRSECLTNIVRQRLHAVQVVLVVGHVVAVLLQQFEVQLLFFDGRHAQPSRQGMLASDGLGDRRGSSQVDIDGGLRQLFERLVL